MMAWARSSSWRTRPQPFSDLLVVKIMERLRRCRSLTTEEHVCGIRPVGEIADLVNDQDRRVPVHGKRLCELACAKRGGEVVDERRRGGEVGVEAVLDRTVGDRDSQMGFPAPRLAPEDQRSAVRHKIGRQRGSEEIQADRRLIREIEIIDGLRKRKMGPSDQPSEPRLLPVGDLFGHEQREEVAIGPGLSFGALDQIALHPSRIGEVQPLEERVEIRVGRDHDRPPTRRVETAVLSRVQVLRCAPPRRAPSPTWTRLPRGSRAAAIVVGRSSKGRVGVAASR